MNYLRYIYIYIYISMFDFMVLKFELYSSGLILSKNIYLHLFQISSQFVIINESYLVSILVLVSVSVQLWLLVSLGGFFLRVKRFNHIFACIFFFKNL